MHQLLLHPQYLLLLLHPILSFYTMVKCTHGKHSTSSLWYWNKWNLPIPLFPSTRHFSNLSSIYSLNFLHRNSWVLRLSPWLLLALCSRFTSPFIVVASEAFLFLVWTLVVRAASRKLTVDMSENISFFFSSSVPLCLHRCPMHLYALQVEQPLTSVCKPESPNYSKHVKIKSVLYVNDLTFAVRRLTYCFGQNNKWYI